ncbi:MAG TPA: hypothetical protein VHB47_05910 [Thermoanaerobaculia bacterium]|nr:hypothetical protein [Thermoanaerobaculia bacterium]
MRSHLLKGRLARWALPPATLAAIGCFAAHEVDPVAAAEGAYLGRLTAAVLVAVAALAPPPAAELGLGGVLAATAVWALPAGPGRGAALMALLIATLAVAAGRRLRRMATAAEDGAGAGRARLAAAVALCFGCQVLLRGELLFAPGRALRPWVALLVLPIAAGAALALLWRRRGMVPALAAAAAAAVLAPGWTVATTLAMVALAGGDSLLGKDGATAGGSWWLWRVPASADRGEEGKAGALAPGATRPLGRTPAALATGARHSLPHVTRLAAGVAALLLPVAWEPRSGWAAALAGLALWRPGLAAGVALPLAALTRGAALAGLGLPGALAAHASWREGAAGLAWLVMLVPAALTAARQPRLRALLAAVALLAFATPWLPDRTALAAPIALAALALPAAGAAAGLAAVWSAAVLFGTALLASYPWLRLDSLSDTLALLGRGAGPRLAAMIGGAALLVTGAVELALRRSAPGPTARSPAAARGTRIAAMAAGAVLLMALVGPQVVSPGTALLAAGDAVLLDRANPSWYLDLGPQRSRGLVLQTSLIHAAGLGGGTPVARVRLLGTGAPPVELQLRAGDDTGEWAARRPDVAAAARARAPRPWLAWVAGTFFGQRYRARLPLPRAGSFARLEIDLAAGLPPDTGLAIYQVELEP